MTETHHDKYCKHMGHHPTLQSPFTVWSNNHTEETKNPINFVFPEMEQQST